MLQTNDVLRMARSSFSGPMLGSPIFVTMGYRYGGATTDGNAFWKCPFKGDPAQKQPYYEAGVYAGTSPAIAQVAAFGWSADPTLTNASFLPFLSADDWVTGAMTPTYGTALTTAIAIDTYGTSGYVTPHGIVGNLAANSDVKLLSPTAGLCSGVMTEAQPFLLVDFVAGASDTTLPENFWALVFPMAHAQGSAKDD